MIVPGFFADCDHADRWIDVNGEKGAFYEYILLGCGSIQLKKVV